MPICTLKRTAIFRFALAALLASASMSWASNASKGPDAGNYTATDSTVYSFIDLAASGGGANVLAGTDDGVALLTLPFPFQFYGASYTFACVSVNGVVSFVTSPGTCTPTADFVNTDLSSTPSPGDLPSIFPYWTDLTFQVPGSGAVYYGSQGAPGTRQFIIEWTNASLQGSPNQVTFEAILSEGTNQILFQYQSVDFGQGTPGTNGSLSTVGIRDAGGQTNGREIAWSYNAGVLANASAILFSGAASQVSNTITTSPAGLTVTIDGTSYPSPKTVSWTPGSSHTLSVTTPQINSGIATQYNFTGWSTGESTPVIAVSAPGTGATFTANFQTKTIPTITWTAPAPIQFTSALGSLQLNATANVPGLFVYTPPAGTVLPVGNNQKLSVTFTPAETDHYTTATASTTIDVLPGTYSGVQIIITRVLSRDANNNIVVQLTVANAGQTAASNLRITSLKIGTTVGSPLPTVVGSLPAESLTHASFTVPGTAGSPGASGVLSVSGTYSGGTFITNSRIVFP